MFNDQCELSLKTKPKGKKGYNKVHNAQDGTKPLNAILIVICGVEAHQQEIWAMMKSNKHLYTFFQNSNMTNDIYVKYPEAYIKVI